MYHLIKNGPNVHLGVDANGAVEVIAHFASSPTLKTHDLAILAVEMVAVLNRDLENRANDIAATPENIATSDAHWAEHAPEWWKHSPIGCGEEDCPICHPGDQEQPPAMPNASDPCGNPDCGCGTRVVNIRECDNPECLCHKPEVQRDIHVVLSRPSNWVGLSDEEKMSPPPPITQYPMQKNKWTADPAVEEAPDYATDQTGVPAPGGLVSNWETEQNLKSGGTTDIPKEN